MHEHNICNANILQIFIYPEKGPRPLPRLPNVADDKLIVETNDDYNRYISNNFNILMLFSQNFIHITAELCKNTVSQANMMHQHRSWKYQIAALHLKGSTCCKYAFYESSQYNLIHLWSFCKVCI